MCLDLEVNACARLYIDSCNESYNYKVNRGKEKKVWQSRAGKREDKIAKRRKGMKFCCTHVIVPGGMQKCRFSFSSCMSFIFAFLCAGEFFFFSLGCKCPRAGVYPSYTNTANTQQALTSTRASCHPTARENVFCVTRKGGVPWQCGMRNSASS